LGFEGVEGLAESFACGLVVATDGAIAGLGGGEVGQDSIVCMVSGRNRGLGSIIRFLWGLPERIRSALKARAVAMNYLVWAIVEMAFTQCL
jgi:hypothetical protein